VEVAGFESEPSFVAGAPSDENQDIDAVAATLQTEGASSFVKSWNDLMSVLASKSETLKAA